MNMVYSQTCFSVCLFSRFATLENTGLLFYNGRFNEKHDFIALEIQDGQVVLKYSTGTLPMSLFMNMYLFNLFYPSKMILLTNENSKRF